MTAPPTALPSSTPTSTLVATATIVASPTATASVPASATTTAAATATATVTATSSPSPSATLVAANPLSGGATTVFNVTRNAFALPAANLPAEREQEFFVGNAFFNRNWVTAPASTTGQDGLGPMFNAVSCSACHFKDGRGRPPNDEEDSDPALLFRFSVPGAGDHGQPLPDPAYGDQLQPAAILGVPPEGRVRIRYAEMAGEYGDGEPFSLRVPSYEVVDLAYGPLADDVRLSPRVAPAMIGLGLLAAVSETSVRAWADEADVDGDGISGRPNEVWDVRAGASALGRFGWKANQPTLEQQSAGAFNGDIGITSPLFTEQSCTTAQAECAAAPDGGRPEVDQRKLDAVTFYSHLLAVPARRDVADPQVLRGEELFAGAGCGDCHVASMTTGELAGFPEVSGQSIHPYTDLLLHDLGDGLADGRSDFLADGREWRTPPLWGIGLVETVNRHSNFLHDGRARGFAEAILWHGGEAEGAREAFRLMSQLDREALLRFLGSL